MDTVEVHAYAIASTLPIKTLPPLLGEQAPEARRAATQITVRRGERAWIVAYDFGAIVFFGVAEKERKEILEKVLAKVGPEPHPPLHEELLVELDGDRPVEASFDRVALPQLDAKAVELVALVVAQSAAMEYYEEDVDRILERFESIASGLEQHGRFRGNVRELLRFVGRGMSLRNRVVHTLALLDSPELTWEDEILDRLYRELRQSFAIEDRYRALDHKLQMIGQNLEIVVDLTQSRRSMLLEVLVVVLIFIETVLFVLQMKPH